MKPTDLFSNHPALREALDASDAGELRPGSLSQASRDALARATGPYRTQQTSRFAPNSLTHTIPGNGKPAKGYPRFSDMVEFMAQACAEAARAKQTKSARSLQDELAAKFGPEVAQALGSETLNMLTGERFIVPVGNLAAEFLAVGMVPACSDGRDGQPCCLCLDRADDQAWRERRARLLLGV